MLATALIGLVVSFTVWRMLVVQERQLLISRHVDDVRVILIDRDRQQPIVIRWLLVRRNPEPFVERIKHFKVCDDGQSIGGS